MRFLLKKHWPYWSHFLTQTLYIVRLLNEMERCKTTSKMVSVFKTKNIPMQIYKNFSTTVPFFMIFWKFSQLKIMAKISQEMRMKILNMSKNISLLKYCILIGLCEIAGNFCKAISRGESRILSHPESLIHNITITYGNYSVCLNICLGFMAFKPLYVM